MGARMVSIQNIPPDFDISETTSDWWGKHNRSDRISQTPRPRNKTDTILNHGIGQTDF